jgi:hypothetical protein
MHGLISVSGAQTAPPWTAAVTTLRARELNPPPQEAEHVPHALNDDTWQSTAQGCALHACSSRSVGQGDP